MASRPVSWPALRSCLAISRAINPAQRPAAQQVRTRRAGRSGFPPRTTPPCPRSARAAFGRAPDPGPAVRTRAAPSAIARASGRNAATCPPRPWMQNSGVPHAAARSGASERPRIRRLRLLGVRLSSRLRRQASTPSRLRDGCGPRLTAGPRVPPVGRSAAARWQTRSAAAIAKAAVPGRRRSPSTASGNGWPSARRSRCRTGRYRISRRPADLGRRPRD